MADIFTPWQINQLTIPNRLVRSATWEGMAKPDGTPTEDTVNLTAALAEGGVGLIVTGYAFVRPEGRGLIRQTGVHIDAMVGPLTRITDAVHKCGGLVALQMVHAGGQTRSAWIGGQTPRGPSALVHPAFKEQVAELTIGQIEEIVEAFAAGAARAKAAGFDGVQMHGAHGYLINQFLSPNTNQRRDDYGGSLKNRARFCYQAYQAVRQAVGPHFPVFIKLGTEDGLPGGLVLHEAIEVAAELSRMGLDAIEVSGGVPAAGKKASARVVRGPAEEGYFLANARAVKAKVSCPVIAVGGFRSRAVVEAALDQVDAVAMARPFIRQPDLALRWKQGSLESAECISCGKCLGLGLQDGIACAQKTAAQT
jgi:2,4-dienoyl-CoA reductase-like NADH-dependent reductase (Old Yellow Enzyme family)